MPQINKCGFLKKKNRKNNNLKPPIFKDFHCLELFSSDIPTFVQNAGDLSPLESLYTASQRGEIKGNDLVERKLVF